MDTLPLVKLPTVSVILAVLDERDHIDDVLEDLTSQTYANIVEFVVADGGSTDGTTDRLAEWAERDPRLKVIHNASRLQSFGLNAAAAVATGEYLCRADGHTRYDAGYVAASVAVAAETGGMAGGQMNPAGTTPFERAVAAVMNTRLLMPARFHHATTRQEVDTVYLGTMPRKDFLAAGGYRAFPSGSGEDADFAFRWRANGGRVSLDPSIRSAYRPRSTVGALWRQYARYGRVKAEMLWVNGRFPSWRPLAPAALVSGLAVSLGIGVFVRTVWPFLVLVAAWLGFLVAVTIARRAGWRFVVAAGIMQLSYGLGMIAGLVAGRPTMRGGVDTTNLTTS